MYIKLIKILIIFLRNKILKTKIYKIIKKIKNKNIQKKK